MKKIFFLIMLLTILILPLKVEAYEISEDGSTYTFNICKEGCEYNQFPSIDNSIPEDVLLIFKLGEGEFVSDDNYISLDDNNIIIEGQEKEKTTLYVEYFDLLYIDNFEIKNITIKNNSQDIWRDGFIEIWSVMNFKIENVDILSGFKENIRIESHYDSTGIFDNVNIIGATDYAIAIYKSSIFLEESYKIINSNLSNNACSVLAEINGSAAVPSNKKYNIGKIKLLSNTNIKKDVILENSKISCAAAIKKAKKEAPIIYIPANNTWTIPPKKNENVFEVDGGRVIIEQEKEEAFELKSNVSKRISDIFKDVDLEDAVWENSNPEVAKIENDEIIPLKKGTTIFSTEVSEINYSIKVKVEENPKINKSPIIENPKTNNLVNFLILIISGIVTLGICIITYNKKEKINKL